MGLGVSAYGAGQVMTSIAGQSLIMHTGNLPGQTTLFIRLPDSGLAVAILTNEDQYAGLFLQYAAAVRIASDVLGLPPVDLEQEAADQIKLAVFLTTPVPPENPAPVPEGTQPTGTFSHPGYASFTLQPMNGDSPVEAAITARLGRLGLRTTDVLYAKLDGFIDTHMTLTHWDGAGFNATLFQVAEHGGKVIVPDAGGTFPAIITPEGIGMFGNFWGAGDGAPNRDPNAENVKEAAEVFFSRSG
jgi:hypothetical protein